jgi:hypothetical protein
MKQFRVEIKDLIPKISNLIYGNHANANLFSLGQKNYEKGADDSSR